MNSFLRKDFEEYIRQHLAKMYPKLGRIRSKQGILKLEWGQMIRSDKW
jgi:hypothetical protein